MCGASRGKERSRAAWFRSDLETMVRGWGGVRYVKRKTMLFKDSESVRENRGVEITYAVGSGFV
jgi:hypothetical protein